MTHTAFPYLMIGLLAAAGPAWADDLIVPQSQHHHHPMRPTQTVSHTASLPLPPAPVPEPQRLAALGRYVALAPGCNLRDPLWAERLNMALNQAIAEAGVDGEAARREIVDVEMRARRELRENAMVCHGLTAPPGPEDLRRADEMVR